MSDDTPNPIPTQLADPPPSQASSATCATCRHAIQSGDRVVFIVDGDWTEAGVIDPVKEVSYFHYECFLPTPDGPPAPPPAPPDGDLEP